MARIISSERLNEVFVLDMDSPSGISWNPKRPSSDFAKERSYKRYISMFSGKPAGK